MENKIYYLEASRSILKKGDFVIPRDEYNKPIYAANKELLKAFIEVNKRNLRITICYFIIKPKNTQHNEPKN
jgi:hypothetical protein